QIFVDAAGDMELIPRVGNQTILFGDEKQMEEKFNKLYTFYKKGLSKTGWNQYKTINVTFKDQVVCSK
ncbi:MAG: cell division protein FtsQ, partial [Bacteroidota bacterium]